MTILWRVVKNATKKDYEYVALEFDMLTGQVAEIRVDSNKTSVRKRKTVEFEVLENNEWWTIPYKDVPFCMKEFNQVRIKNGYDPLTEQDVLARLYSLDSLK